MNKKLVSLLLSGIMVVTLPGMSNLSTLTVFADQMESDEDEIEIPQINISTVDEFVEFAKEARTQEYSSGRIVTLENDIDLSGYPNTTIPFMDGYFDGKGHTISGVVLYEDLSNDALFRYVGENGQIKNLIIDAKINSGDEQQYIGIVAGSNSGHISNCTVRGTMDAQSQVGGIAGINEKSGIIDNCINEAEVNGKYQTGGIAGINLGSIFGCTNNGRINANSHIQKNTIDSDGSSVNISISNAVTGIAADERANESGGIVGYNEGDIANSTNKGVVGCFHLGSAAGGIVGHLYGNVRNCSNEGTVYGHKMIGGIVGYFEPSDAFSYDVDYVQQLKDQLDELSDIVDELADAGKTLGDDFSANTDKISDEIKDLRHTLQNYGDAYDYDFDSARGSIKAQTDEIKEVVDDMDYDFKTKQLMKAVTALKNDVDKMLELLAKLRAMLSTASASELEMANDTLKKMEKFESSSDRYLEVIKKTQKLLDEKAGSPSKNSDRVKTEEASEEATVEQIVSEIPYNGAENEVSIQALSGNTLIAIKQILEELAKYDADAKKQSDLIMKYLNRMPKEFDEVKDDFEDMREDLGDAYNLTYDYLNKLSSRTDSLRYDLRIQGDSISDTLDYTHDQMDDDWRRFNNSISALTDKAHDLRTTISDGYDEIRNRIEDHNVYVDISELAEVKNGKGRIISCKNNGEIYSDSLSGGIVGIIDKTDSSEVALGAISNIFGMAFDADEEDDDDEEEENEEEKDSITKHVEAVIYDCKNSADIFIKGDYAGGIVGKAAYGLVKDCQNYGDVNSEEGKYIGGIAGLSKLSITGSYMMGGLYGTSYVGGVAGKGNDITDSFVCAYMDMDNEYAKAAGAIAGKGTGIAYGNVFVDNGLGAINGVTKTSEAKGLSYAQMLSQYDLPKEFKVFTIRFIDENEVIWSNEFKYGEELLEENYPELIPNEGEYAYWEEKNLSPICRSVTVHSFRRVFFPSVQAKLAGSESSKPDLILGGDFYPDTELSVSMANESEAASINNVKQQLQPDMHYVITKSYHYKLTQERPLNGNVNLRVLKDSLIPSNTLLILDKDFNSLTGVVRVDSIDSFLTIDTTIPDEGYVVVIEKVSRVTVVAVAAGIIVVLVLLVLLLLFMRRKRKALKEKIKQALADTEKPIEELMSEETAEETNTGESEEKNE